MLYITLFDIVCSFKTAGTHCRKLVRAEKFKMASKMVAEFKRTGLSLGSLQWIFVNRYSNKEQGTTSRFPIPGSRLAFS